MSSDPDDLVDFFGNKEDPNVIFLALFLEHYFLRKESMISISDLANTILQLKISTDISVSNVAISVPGARINKNATFSYKDLREYNGILDVVKASLQRYLTFLGKETFDEMVNEISPNIGSRISDPKLIEAVMAHQKSVVDKLTAPPSSVAGTSFPLSSSSTQTGSSIKHKKPSRRFASEKVIDI